MLVDTLFCMVAAAMVGTGVMAGVATSRGDDAAGGAEVCTTGIEI